MLPGKYLLSLMFMDPGERTPRTSIGSITREVEVPEIPGGRTDEPLDLGELQLARRSAVRPVMTPDNPPAERAPE